MQPGRTPTGSFPTVSRAPPCMRLSEWVGFMQGVGSDGGRHADYRRGMAPETPPRRDAVEAPATTIVLNDRFITHIGEGRLPDYVRTLVGLARDAKGGKTVEVTKRLSATLASHGYPIPPIEAERLAEQLIRADGRTIAITRGDGTVLHGPGGTIGETE